MNSPCAPDVMGKKQTSADIPFGVKVEAQQTKYHLSPVTHAVRLDMWQNCFISSDFSLKKKKSAAPSLTDESTQIYNRVIFQLARISCYFIL